MYGARQKDCVARYSVPFLPRGASTSAASPLKIIARRSNRNAVRFLLPPSFSSQSEYTTPQLGQDGQNATEVRKIGAQFDEGYKVELAKNFRDVVNSGFRAANLPEFSDIPGSDVDGFVELGWGDLGCGNSRFEREQTVSNLR